MKIFVSYSRRDAGDFANQINRHLSSFNYDIFTDVDDIRAGDIWSNTITSNISNCDIFVVIVTRGALQSPHVEREVLQAQKENKKIIPCFFRNINPNKIKWELDKIQGMEFSDKYELARELDSKINIESNIPIDKDTESIIGSVSKSVKDINTDKMTPTKPTIDKPAQKKEDLQPISKGRIGTLGSGVLSIPSNTADVRKTTTKPNIDKLEEKKDRLQPSPKIIPDDKVQSKRSRNIPVVTTKKESTEPKAKDTGKPSQGIFRSTSKTSEETKTHVPTTTIKSDTGEIYQKKDTLPSSNVNTGAIGGDSGVPSPPKYRASGSDNNETKYSERDSNRQSQGINLKLIIIPILAVAIIGVIVAVSYFSVLSPADRNKQIETTPPPPSDILQSYHFINAWGSEGNGTGQFSSPEDIAVDSTSGNVYVVDSFLNSRIQKFDSNGKFIATWGSNGTGDGEFDTPSGIAVDSSDNVYVADSGNNRIQKFDSNGKFITKWGSNGTGDGEFDYPADISVDSSGNVYVADHDNHRIQKFDSNGTFITKWGSGGTGDGEFIPWSIAVDSSGNVYVTDYNNHRIQKFDSNGKFITKWGSFGTGDGEFYPWSSTVDSSGNVYVADDANQRIQKFDSNGTFITKWGRGGTGDGEFYSPRGIAVDSSGNVYVTDTSTYRIQVFAPTTK